MQLPKEQEGKVPPERPIMSKERRPTSNNCRKNALEIHWQHRAIQKEILRTQIHLQAPSIQTLCHNIWDKQLGTEPTLKWEILEKAYPYTKGSRNCGLCLAEKMHIMRQINNPIFLNKWPKQAQKCRHKSKFRLSNYKWSTKQKGKGKGGVQKTTTTETLGWCARKIYKNVKSKGYKKKKIENHNLRQEEKNLEPEKSWCHNNECQNKNEEIPEFHSHWRRPSWKKQLSGTWFKSRYLWI